MRRRPCVRGDCSPGRTEPPDLPDYKVWLCPWTRASASTRSRPAATIGSEVAYGEYEPHFEQTLGLGAALRPHDHDVLAAHAHP